MFGSCHLLLPLAPPVRFEKRGRFGRRLRQGVKRLSLMSCLGHERERQHELLNNAARPRDYEVMGYE